MQTLIQFAFIFAFMLFSMLSGMMISTTPVVAIAALIIAALCALVAVVLVLEESAEQRAFNNWKARQ